MPPWTILIIFAVLASCAVVVVGYVRGNRKRRTAASAEPADAPVTTAGSIQPAWDEKAAHTDSWIWR
jgi:flagellar basal body-associated protein FliL